MHRGRRPGETGARDAPLNAGQDRGDVICRTPSVLQNVQAELPGGVDVWVEHLADEFDGGRLIRILLFELHHQPECSILEGGVAGSDDYRVPAAERHVRLSCAGRVRGDARLGRTKS